MYNIMVNLLPTAEGPADDDDCMMYLAASCSTVSSLRLQKCKPVGLDSIVQSRDTVDPSGAPINCWCSATDGGTAVIKKNEKKTKQNKEKLAIGNCWKPGGLLRSVRLGFSLLWERERVCLFCLIVEFSKFQLVRRWRRLSIRTRRRPSTLVFLF